MKLLIFGATGGTGLALVSQALARGHSVTAFARTPAKLPGAAGGGGATVIKGDVLDAAAVSAAVAAAAPDAILVALGGAGLMARDFNCSRGTDHILAGVRAAGGAPRVVLCSSMGVAESAAHIPTFVRWLLKHPLADKAPQEAAVRAAGLPFVIVRPTGLRDGPPRGPAALAARVGERLPTSAVARADVAAFMLDALASDEWLGQTVGLSWATA
jgi:uncharacterized protein YbjT (DUF2867 family)